MKLTMWRVVVVLTRSFGKNSLLHLSFKETSSPETCLQIKDNNNSPNGFFFTFYSVIMILRTF